MAIESAPKSHTTEYRVGQNPKLYYEFGFEEIKTIQSFFADCYGNEYKREMVLDNNSPK